VAHEEKAGRRQHITDGQDGSFIVPPYSAPMNRDLDAPLIKRWLQELLPAGVGRYGRRGRDIAGEQMSHPNGPRQRAATAFSESQPETGSAAAVSAAASVAVVRASAAIAASAAGASAQAVAASHRSLFVA